MSGSLSNQALTKYVQECSLQAFSLAFRGEARWNSRLRTTGGRFFPRDGHLDFNPRFATHPDLDRIVLHELCHYHLYQEGRGYKHGDQDFKALLAQVGGLRFAPRLTDSAGPSLLYRCTRCGQIYLRKRHINTQKYRCGRCRGSLRLENK